MFQVNEMIFHEKINSGKPLVVLFSASWCHPCRMAKIALKKFEAEYGDRVEFLVVDTDSEQNLCSEHRISGIPFLIFVVGSQIKVRYTGVQSELKIMEGIQEILI